MKKTSNKTPVPFKAGGIVEPPYFIGHKDDLRTLIYDAENLSQNNIVIAPRRYGKTSLLHNIKTYVTKTTDIIIPEINCLEIDTMQDFYKIVIKSILTSYEQKRKVKGLLTSFRTLFKGKITEGLKSIEKVGGSIESIGEIYLHFRENSKDEFDLARATFDFINDFSHEKDQDIILIFDEFQKIDSLDHKLYNLFKKSMDSHKRIRYYFSGSSLAILNKIFLRPNSPLYLMAGKRYLSPLDKNTVIDFVKKRFKIVQLEVQKNTAELFYEYTGGIPYYVQKLGLICFHAALLEKIQSIEERMLSQGYQTMLDEFDGEFESRLQNRFSDNQRRIIKAVSLLGEASLTEIAKEIKCKPTDISSNVNRLYQAMLLLKNSTGKYRVSDEVFRKWVMQKIIS